MGNGEGEGNAKGRKRRAKGWKKSRRASGGLMEPLSGFRAFAVATQGRTAAGRKCDGSTLGWIMESFQDWRRFLAR